MSYNKFICAAITVFVVVLAVISTTEACMCQIEHPQNAYCKAEYVIYARIVNRKLIPGTSNVVYKIDIRKELKVCV